MVLAGVVGNLTQSYQRACYQQLFQLGAQEREVVLASLGSSTMTGLLSSYVRSYGARLSIERDPIHSYGIDLSSVHELSERLTCLWIFCNLEEEGSDDLIALYRYFNGFGINSKIFIF